MKKIKIALIIIVFLLVQTISALTIEIDMKDSFNLGESVSYDYKLLSDEDILIRYLPYAECPNAPQPFLEEKEITLKANEQYTDFFSYIDIDESIEPQTCTAYIQIMEPVQIREEKTFEIITNPSFSFEIKLNKKVFVQNEDININYESEVSDPTITASLKYPDGTTESINLPSSIKAIQIGTYEIEVSASKTGYKSISVKEQFGVIEKQAEIRQAELPMVSVAPEILGEEVDEVTISDEEEVTISDEEEVTISDEEEVTISDEEEKLKGKIQYNIIIGILLALIISIIIWLVVRFIKQ